MKELKLSIYFISFILILLVSSCKKEPFPNELPPLTMTGENTFGCLINDEVFVPTIRRIIGPDGGSSSEIVFHFFPSLPDYLLTFSAHRRAYQDEKIKDIDLYFELTNIDSLGKYSFSGILLYYREIGYENILNGEINILYYDSIAEIISGKFSATVFNYSDTMNITDGRFDIKITL